MQKIHNINDLINMCREYHISESDIQKIENAAIFAEKKHKNQLRKSGEPYIIHPLSTAAILLSWKMDVKTIITGLLHDVLEDTPTTEEEIKTNFGNDIYQLVSYVTKVNMFSKENRENNNKSSDKNEYLIQVLLSMSHDIRAMIVKLADRYHNMLTINFLPEHKKQRIAAETLNVYAKVAGRLGMYRLKTNLLDLSFEVLDKKAYDETKQILDNISSTYQNIWDDTTNKIIGILDSYSIQYTLKKRIKGIYSTYEKIQKGYRIKDIHDIYAIRIITNDNLDCYTVLGLVHLNFFFISKAFKDYISMPKFNYYQSLHTTIIKDQALIEVQIRTQQMDLFAENGVAAHWNYKDAIGINDFSNNFWIEEIKNLQDKTHSNIYTITNDEVFTVAIVNEATRFTVNNKTRCIDLAYRFDNDKFKYLKKITVNGKSTTFDTLLKPQDVVNFIYSNNVQISRKWLKFTNFHGTIKGIKEILKNESTVKFISETDFLNAIKEKLGENYLGDNEVLAKIKKRVGINSIHEFLDYVSDDLFNNPEFFKLFDKRKQIRRKAFNTLLSHSSLPVKTKKEFYFDVVDGLYFSDLQFPNCCNKVPGLEVVGFVDKNSVFQVHNHNCPIIAKKVKYKTKLFPLKWNNDALTEKPRKFRYALEFVASWTPSIGNIVAIKLKRYDNLINEIIVEKQKNTTLCNIKIVVYTSHVNSIKAAVTELNQEIDIKTNISF